MFPEDFAGVFFDFAERYGLETACALQPEAVGADAAKQIEDAKLFHLSRIPHGLEPLVFGVDVGKRELAPFSANLSDVLPV